MSKGYIDGFTCSWQEDCFNYKVAKHFKEKLDEIKAIIKTDFEASYMELSFNEYDKILEKIKSIVEGAEDE